MKIKPELTGNRVLRAGVLLKDETKNDQNCI